MENKNLQDLANILRRDVLKMTTIAGSGHPTSCLSAAEIISTLFFHEMQYNKQPFNPNNDEFILSKGHAAPILYSALKNAKLIKNNLNKLRKLNSKLEGHPIPKSIKQVKHQLETLKKMNIKPQKAFKAKKNDIIIDALVGYSLKGPPRGRIKELINAINFMKKSKIKVFSLDIPSGIDPNKGIIHKTYVDADYTLTLAIPKKGLKKLNKVFLANIGIPNKVYSDLKIKIPNYFKDRDILII